MLRCYVCGVQIEESPYFTKMMCTNCLIESLMAQEKREEEKKKLAAASTPPEEHQIHDVD